MHSHVDMPHTHTHGSTGVCGILLPPLSCLSPLTIHKGTIIMFVMLFVVCDEGGDPPWCLDLLACHAFQTLLHLQGSSTVVKRPLAQNDHALTSMVLETLECMLSLSSLHSFTCRAAAPS